MLEEYKEKRDFNRTSEPSPGQQPEDQGPLVFVVQKHEARRLHYDFRLELGGVLKSWSVPAGPSLDPGVKRLAVMVEDHPLDYASFEGSIPRGEYGAGQVIVWDNGDYSPDEDGTLSFGDRVRAQERIREGLARGKLSIFLRGHKLRGSWTLVKMRRGKDEWLLIKHSDHFANSTRDVLEKGASVVSALTIEDLKTGRQLIRPVTSAARLSGIPGARRAPLPTTVFPMLAAIAKTPFSNPGWVFEPKLDGYRALAVLQDSTPRLISRRGIDVTRKYANIVEGMRRQPAGQLLLDGEIIALDERGKLCFQCLQSYLETMNKVDGKGKEAFAIIYYVFDILYVDGYDLREVPLGQRKKVLDRVLYPSEAIRFLEHFEGDGIAIYRSAVEQGLEGVVAKRKDSLYETGQRSKNWLKIKSIRTDDFIIGGYTQGSGNRSRTFGALLLGYYDDQGRLIPAGHVGTGFDERILTDLRKRLDAIQAEQCPFAEIPELNSPATWVRPELVAEIKFSQWTWDGRLRAPVYLRLREDKPSSQVRRVQSVSVSSRDAPGEGRSQAQPVAPVASVLEQLKNPRDSFAIDVEGQRVGLTSLDKELWPGTDKHPALTKRDLLTYLARVAPYLLKHLRDRPLTLSRYPDGIHGEHFFQKHWSSPLPDFVVTAQLAEHGRKRGEYLLCNNFPTLLWLGQVADLELHTWSSRINPEPDADIPAESPWREESVDFLSRYPDFIIFDLDPYIYSGAEPQGAEPQLNREGFARTCEAARWLKETLDALSLSSFIKTSGRTGLHVYVPVLRQFDYRAVHSAAKTICRFVLQHHPRSITTEWAVAKRSGKVFFDYNQNLRGKTLASVYSPRPAPEATVSTPLQWDELGKVYPSDFTIITVPDRLSELGDLWMNIINAKRDLKHLLKLS